VKLGQRKYEGAGTLKTALILYDIFRHCCHIANTNWQILPGLALIGRSVNVSFVCQSIYVRT
jgi:hypothetical protein